MKKEYTLLYIILVSFILVIFLSVYSARRNLLKTLEGQPQHPDKETVGEQASEEIATGGFPQETYKPQGRMKKEDSAELNLSQIPDKMFTDMAKDEPRAGSVSAGEKQLKKQPTVSKLKELKSKGVLIH